VAGDRIRPMSDVMTNVPEPMDRPSRLPATKIATGLTRAINH
jgi:hypothetical protein